MRLAFSVAINVDAEILLINKILSVSNEHFQSAEIGRASCRERV